MKKITTLFCFISFLILTCKEKKSSESYLNLSRSEYFYFNYGSRSETSNLQTNKSRVFFEPEIRESEFEVCIHSHPIELELSEWGPVSKFCFVPSNNTSENLKSAISDLRNSDSSKIFLESSLQTKEGIAELKFYNSNEIAEIAISSEENILLIGDKKLHDKIFRNPTFKPIKFYSKYSKSENNYETSYSARYPTYILDENGLTVFFPPNNLDISSDSEMYIGIFFSTENTMLINAFTAFINTIPVQNENFRNTCTNLSPELTELANFSNFPLKRFLEFKNPNIEKAICLTYFSINNQSNKTEFENTSGFMLPGSVKLIIEADSKLEGIQKKEFSWSDIKDKSTIEFTTKQTNFEWSLPEKLEMNFESDFFSIRNDGIFHCNTSPILYKKSANICSSPGSEIYFETTDISNCDPEKFFLTEINFGGVQIDNTLSSKGNFIELQYTGEVCDISFMKIINGKSHTPLSVKNQNITTNQTFLIGHSDIFQNLTNLIKRDLSSLSPYSSVSISNGIKEKVLFKAIEKETILINKNASGETHSIILEDNSFQFHPPFTSSYLRPDSKRQNTMSPGEIHNKYRNTIYSKINEINPFGSYKDGMSITKDKFIEFYSTGNGTLSLEIIGESNYQKIIFPVIDKEKFSYIAKDKPECFSEAGLIQSPSFRLNSENLRLILKDFSNNKVLDEVVFQPAKGHGLNSNSPKLRRSYTRTGYLNQFKNSTKDTESGVFYSCLEETEMSPGKENFFFPYLVLQNNFLGSRDYLIIKPKNYKFSFLNIRQYTAEPFSEFNSEISITPSYEFEPITIFQGNTLSERGMIYQSIGNSEEIKIIPREGIFIQAILPDPSNSQNEWILLCNYSDTDKDLTNFEIEDESATDKITSYFKRKKINLPSGLDDAFFYGNTTILKSNQCGYLIDPDAYNIFLRPFGITPTNIFTIDSTSAIGNGISNNEKVDLYEITPTSRVHIHSYGNKRSHSPFSINSKKDEVILLLPKKSGETAEDYEIQLWQ
ncbi:MAG: lamin tail domain-containing protein [Leptospiraceae bacterium]|nr:lamin tail domain-containing protein [Leptospiraceae bacterium]MCK6381831.1 lamin tail domain-containing protein [Leptospiraceae bacterium]NUM41361.1 lamin tail domain-containing protein [Leptospiraceae bacterium]